MRKALLLLVGTAVLWVPAVSVAGDSSKPTANAKKPDAKSDVSNPAGTCQSQRNKLNFAASHSGQTFAQFYGTNGANGRGAGANAFGKCVSTIAKHKDKSDDEGSAESHSEDSAGSQGKDGGKSDGEDSAKGDDEGSAKSHGEGGVESQGEDSVRPAMICKAMQAKDLAHFETLYGRRPSAFGHCVAKQANSKKP